MSKLQVDHLGFAVTKIEPIKRFLTEYLGGVELEVEAYPVYNLISQMVQFENIKVELIESCDDTGLVARFIKNYGEGFHHLSLQVEDLEAEIARFKGGGYEVIGDVLITEKGDQVQKVVFLNPKDTHSLLIELKEEKRVERMVSAWEMISQL